MLRPTSHSARTGACLEREGRVVECGGETVVRFPGDCAASSGTCCCTGATRVREIPAAWLGLHDAREGEALVVAVPRRAVTRVAVLLFAVPLAALLAGAWLGGAGAAALGQEADVAGGIAGLLCLAVAMSMVAGRGAAMTGTLQLKVRRRRTD